MNVIQEINNVNDKFATEGGKLRIEKRGEKLNIRGSLPSKNGKNDFTVQRISLGLKADFNGLEEAKKKGPKALEKFEANNKWTPSREKFID